ncbi:hypothetical protein JTE90_022347 [Oedothorax gibbosus]|uniref:Uncharacterized protein n=1 Tax=Oedothorax gibbosus TaxID=931172 RepID=A0AAV6VUX4_9ARAC|nr:hypothetical protein JTE90_022347 [Oedothorax gibbosus]
MASSNISEKTKLLQELQFYTSLVSNHVKRLETSKAPGIKRSVLIKPFEKNGKLGNSSQSPKVYTAAGAFPQKPVASQANKYQRFVVQSGKLKYPQKPTPSLLFKRSVIKPSLSNINRNLPTVSSLKKINSNQPIFVPNTKQVVTKGAVSSRSVLPPQSTLKVINGTASNLFTPASDRSKDLQKALTETKKIFVKIGAAKHIDELNKLTKQLEKKKMVSALKTSNSLNKILANSSVSDNTKSCDLKSTANCNSLSKMNSLESRVENIAKILATTSNNSSKKVANKSTSGILCPTKRVADSHKIMKNNPCSIMPNTKIDHKLLLSSSQVPEAGKLHVAQLETSTKCLQSTTPVRKEMNLQNCSSMKNSLDLLQTVKHESIQKKNSPRLSRSSSKLITKLVKLLAYQHVVTSY